MRHVHQITRILPFSTGEAASPQDDGTRHDGEDLAQRPVAGIAAAHDIAGEGAHRLDPGVTLAAEATHQYSLFNRMHVEDLSASVIT
jgi:hypothetical protein